MTINRLSMAPPTDEERFHDIVAGQRIVKLLSVPDILLANRLLVQLLAFTFPNRVGRVFLGVLLDLGLGDERQRMPELSYVSYQRWPRQKRLPSDEPWSVVPDLVAEIVTPNCSTSVIETKAREYRNAGVGLVWHLIPQSGRAVVYRGTSSLQVVPRDGELDGGAVLPGFRLPLTTLFEDESA